MAVVDTAIPLSVNTNVQSPQQMISLAFMAQRMREENQKLRAQNALRQIFADPANLGPDGNPTPAAIEKVMSIDPATGMALRQNALETDQANLQLSAMKADAFKKKMGFAHEKASEALTVYEDSMAKGLPEPQARQKAQEAYNQGLSDLKSSGLFSEQEINGISPQFDPTRVRSFSMSYKDWLAQKDKQHKQAEAERHTRFEEGIQSQAAGRSQGEYERKMAGVPLDASGIEEAARTYITTGRLPPGVNPKQIAEITTKAGELRKGGMAAPKELGNPTPVTIKKPDGSSETVEAVYDKLNSRWLTADGRKPITGEVLPAKEVREETGIISDKAANFIADRILAGDPNATRNMSRAKESMGKIQNAVTEKAIDKWGNGPRAAAEVMIATAGVKADQTSLSNLTKMTDAATSFEQTATKNFDLALELAPKAIATDWGPFVNKWIMGGETALGDKSVPPYVTAMLTGANEYAKIMSGSTGSQGSTVDSRKESAELFSPYLAKGQINEVIAVAKRDMANRKKSLNEQINSIKDRMGEESPTSPKRSKPEDTGSVTPEVPASLKGKNLQWSPSRQQFRDQDGTIYDINGKPL